MSTNTVQTTVHIYIPKLVLNVNKDCKFILYCSLHRSLLSYIMNRLLWLVQRRSHDWNTDLSLVKPTSYWVEKGTPLLTSTLIRHPFIFSPSVIFPMDTTLQYNCTVFVDIWNQLSRSVIFPNKRTKVKTPIHYGAGPSIFWNRYPFFFHPGKITDDESLSVFFPPRKNNGWRFQKILGPAP